MNGIARPLICLGGTLCDARVFAPLLVHLGRPGIFWSHNDHDRVAAAATEFLRAAPDEFVVLGFSLGGFVAIDALRMAPGRVAAVILLSGNAFPDDPANAYIRRAEVAAGCSEGLGVWMRGRVAALLSPSCPAPDDVVDLIADMAAAAGHDVHGRQAEMNIHRPDLRSVVNASSRPLLALAGMDDRVCPRDRYLDLQHASSVTLEMIADAGHFLPLEAPVACAAAIDAFLKEHDL